MTRWILLIAMLALTAQAQTRRFVAGEDATAWEGLKSGQDLENLIEYSEFTTNAVDNTTIIVDPTDKHLEVKTNSIGYAYINTNIVDEQTIEWTNGQLGVKSGAIGTNHLSGGTISALIDNSTNNLTDLYWSGEADPDDDYDLTGSGPKVFSADASHHRMVYFFWRTQVGSGLGSWVLDGVTFEISHNGGTTWHFIAKQQYRTWLIEGSSQANSISIWVPRGWQVRAATNEGNPRLIRVRSWRIK